MKITQIMLSKGWGGAERLFVDLCQLLAASGCTVQVICHRWFPKMELLENIEGVVLFPVNARIHWDLIALWRMKQLIKEFSPDVIHTHLSRATWLGGKAGAALSIPVTATTHNNIKIKYCRYVDCFTVTAAHQGRYLQSQNIHPENITLIPNFSRFDALESVLEIKRRPPVFISYGRMVRKKGFDVLLEAFALYLRDVPDGRLIIGGDGPDKAALLQQVASYGIEANVEFSGWIENVPDFLKRGDIFVLPSRDEPFGIVVLEAMALGKPIISSRSQGPSEVLDEKSACLVAIDDEQSLAEAMLAMGRDGVGDGLIKAARALASYKQNYTAAAVVPQYMDHYRHILKAGR